MDGAFKGDITATKWTDNHNDKRTAHKVDGPPKMLKFLQVQKMDGDFKDDKTPQSGWITTTIKELSAKRTDHRNGYKS